MTKLATAARPAKQAFIKRMVSIGVPASRSKRFANTFWALARPEAFGKVVEKKTAGKAKKIVYSVRVPDRGIEVFVSKSRGGLTFGGARKAVAFDAKKRTMKAHK